MTAVVELTVREAAARVSRSEETIRRWIWSGRLPAVKRGHAYYVDVARLDALVVDVVGVEHKPSYTLADWVSEVRAWKAGLDSPALSSAADLVAEDRWTRGERYLGGRDAGR
jgi:excisionase family DNA binding protein